MPNAQAQPQRPEGAAEKTGAGASRNRDWRAVCCLWLCAHRVPGAVPAADELPRTATTHWGAVGCSDRLGAGWKGRRELEIIVFICVSDFGNSIPNEMAPEYRELSRKR